MSKAMMECEEFRTKYYDARNSIDELKKINDDLK